MKAMHENQRVSDMAVEILARQARARTERTGEAFKEALKAVLETEAGRQLRGCATDCTATRGRSGDRRTLCKSGPRSVV